MRLVAVDDVLFREGTTVDGFDEVIPTAHLSDPRHAGRPAVNCAYSLSAWLTLDRLSSAAKCATLDLPELLYLLDIPLVYQTGALTRELAVRYHAEFVSLRERLADEPSRGDPGCHHALAPGWKPFRSAGCRVSGRAGILSLYRGAGHPIDLQNRRGTTWISAPSTVIR
ncbi:hypothetical protein ACPA9J_12580 [Pseudomonas aeruginosa]